MVVGGGGGGELEEGIRYKSTIYLMRTELSQGNKVVSRFYI